MHSIAPLKYPRKSKPGALNPNWNGGKVSKKCEQCGGAFQVIPSRAGKARYCSLNCCNKHIDHRKAINPRVPRKTVYCKQCGTPFVIAAGKAWQRKFCSKQCQFDWRSIHHSGQNNPSWCGGMSKRGMPRGGYPRGWPSISKRILERDRYMCWCPMCLCETDKVAVHHIDFDKSNVSEENLITVCVQCNSRANYDRETWAAVLSNYNRWRLTNGILFPNHRGCIEIKPPGKGRYRTPDNVGYFIQGSK